MLGFLLILNRLKCDRAQPCANCVRRGLAASCQYLRPAAETSPQTTLAPLETEQMMNRIHELEQLVVSLRSTGNSTRPDVERNEDSNSSAPSSLGHERDIAPTPATSEDNSPSESSEKICNAVGRMTIVNQQTVYVSDSHWSAILEKVGNIYLT
jgi:hypothetical protein